MDPVSFAVGLIGLAGLFNTCLDVLDKFDSWKECEDESQALMAQFQAHKLQLDQWGQAVGIQDGTVSIQHDKRLDDPRVLKTVTDLLSAINYICGSHGQRMSLESKRQKLSWALRAKMKATAQVSQFSSIVQTLYALVPVHTGVASRNEESSIKKADNSTDLSHVLRSQGDLIADFKRIMAGIESDMEDKAEARRDLQTWLLGNHPPNDRYEFFTGKRIEGTCEWVFSQPWFQDLSSPDFSHQSAQILWINGPAGFGKTVLSTRIIDHFSSIPDTKVAYFFFSTDHEREDPFLVVRTWISQLIALPEAFTATRKTWNAQQGAMATRKDIMNLLREIVTAIPGCTFVMDGLDECAGDLIFNFMEALMEAIQGTAARLIILSRDEPEIRESLYDHTHNCPVVEHRITPEDVRTDVVSYSRKIVCKELKKSTEATQNDLSQKLADRCNGQFLWVTLQQDSLRRNSWKSPREIEKTINSTPRGLENVYEQNWLKISNLPEEDRGRALSLLRWAAFSLWPLTVNEMTEALLISEDCDEVRIDELPEIIDDDYIEKGLSYYCGSLLEVRSPEAKTDAGAKTVHLAHFSVKQYLLHSVSKGGKVLQMNYALGRFTELAENTLLAKMCLRYLKFLATEPMGHDRFHDFLFDYSAVSWSRHFSLGNSKDKEMVELANQLFDINGPSWVRWRQWLENSIMEDTDEQIEIEESLRGPVYYAARFGLSDMVSFLISVRNHSANEKSCLGVTALAAASANGYLQTAEILLANGADTTALDKFGQTPLHLASSNGHLEVVKLLLEQGAEVQPIDEDGDTPLIRAVECGHVEILTLLIDKGADFLASNEDEWTPLAQAVGGGYLEICKMLLAKGAPVNSAGPLYKRTPLHVASYRGYAAVATLLLENGADPTATDIDGRTPIIDASLEGHLEVVKVLLEKGADPTIPDNRSLTPLGCASSKGHLDIVKLLLESERGLDSIAVCSIDGLTPVHAASSGGNPAVVRLLLEKGADIKKSNIGRTPIHSACESDQDHFEVVKLFIDIGVNLEAEDDRKWRPIHLACQNGLVEVVKLLIENEINLEPGEVEGWRPIHLACRNGHIEVIKLLIVKDINLEPETVFGRRPIHSVCEKGHSEVLELLIENEINLEPEDNDQWRPIHLACQDGHMEVIKLLIENKINLEPEDLESWRPIHLASQNGHSEVVKLLIENEINLEPEDIGKWRPIHLACWNGHIEVIKLLIEKGINLEPETVSVRRPIHLVCEKGYSEVLKLLIENEVNLEPEDNDQWRPIHLACQDGHVEVINLLIENEINLEPEDDNKWRPIHLACQNGHVEVVKLLIENGVNLEAEDNEKWRPIHLACQNGHVDVIKLLIEKGVDAMVASFRGRTPMHIASREGQIEVVKELLPSQPTLEIRDDYGRTALFLAASSGQSEEVHFLLSHGALPTARDRHSTTPLCAAIRNGHEEIVQTLLPLADTAAYFEDGLGRNLVWWARKGGKQNIIELVVQWANRMGIEFQDDDPGAADELIHRDQSQLEVLGICIVCTRDISSCSFYYSCRSCFDFCVCLECHRLGAECFDVSHEWNLCIPESST